MKKEKGITLVTLVITIIILIILAGVSITTLVGDNGIITKAKQARENILYAGKEEQEQLNELFLELEQNGSYTEDEEDAKKDEMIELLQKQVEELKQQVSELQQENESLEQENETMKQEIANLNTQIENLNGQISNLKEEIAEKDIEIADLQKEVALKQETINNLQGQLDSLNSQLAQTNATAAHILKDYKAYSGGKLLVGTMENRGAVSASLNAGQSYTIPAGYHNGSGKVTANSLASQTQGTATANNISSGMTAWVNGQKITGNGTDVNNSYNNGYNAGKQESIANVYVKEMNMGSGGARNCHIIYDITNANVTSISFQTRRGGGQSRNPKISYSEDGTSFTQITEMKGGAAYEYVDRTFDIPSNANFVKLEWEIDNDRAWFHNIKFK